MSARTRRKPGDQRSQKDCRPQKRAPTKAHARHVAEDEQNKYGPHGVAGRDGEVEGALTGGWEVVGALTLAVALDCLGEGGVAGPQYTRADRGVSTRCDLALARDARRWCQPDKDERIRCPSLGTHLHLHHHHHFHHHQLLFHQHHQYRISIRISILNPTVRGQATSITNLSWAVAIEGAGEQHLLVGESFSGRSSHSTLAKAKRVSCAALHSSAAEAFQAGG